MARLEGIVARFEDGEIIFTEGDAAADMYLVTDGSVEIVRERGGSIEVLEVVEPGGFFGEMALFSPGARAATAIARGATEVEVVDLPTFQAFVGDPTVWRICAKLSERCRGASQTEDEITE